MQITIEHAIIHNFKQLQKMASVWLERSNLSSTYVMNEMGMPRATFYRRLRKSDWTPEELETLLNVLTE